MRIPGMRAVATTLLALGLGWGAAAASARPLVFTPDTLGELEQGYADQPFLLVLWSIHCAPCFAELDMLGTLLAEHPDLPLALVSTDPPEAVEEVVMTLEDYGLDHLRSWQFDGFAERLRFAIDPDWFGELPRSYFYDATHARRAHSGTLRETTVRQWLADAEERP